MVEDSVDEELAVEDQLAVDEDDLIVDEDRSRCTSSEPTPRSTRSCSTISRTAASGRRAAETSRRRGRDQPAVLGARSDRRRLADRTPADHALGPDRRRTAQCLHAGARRDLLRPAPQRPATTVVAMIVAEAQTEAPQATASQAEAPSVPNVHDVDRALRSLGRRGVRGQEVSPHPVTLVGRVEAARRRCRDRARSRVQVFCHMSPRCPSPTTPTRLASSTIDTTTDPRAGVAGPRPAQRRVRSRRHRTAGDERLAGVLRPGNQDDLC